MSNRLINERSPYLQQHAHNPVDWYPWGEEAFKKAAEENKPIFLSIGYSTCHWCHVMEKESFENESIANLINDLFVPIKVDREERPDIDNVYMEVCHAITGAGGWPLSIMMTAEKMPFWAGTYIPPFTKYGRTGMDTLIMRVSEIWKNERSQLDNSTKSIMSQLQNLKKSFKGELPDERTLHKAQAQLKARFDKVNGGFAKSPKFPSAHNILFLYSAWNRTKTPETLQMIIKTLDSMMLSGLYDQVGFGFHRYATDETWFLPHFEKMLYDQAMLVLAYTTGYAVTGNNEYRRIAEETIEYLLRDMRGSEGGFYSAEDADSEGEEGRFYTWEYKELEKNLDLKELEFLKLHFLVKNTGNFHDEATGGDSGRNHLAWKILPSAEGDNLWKKIRVKLFDIREQRIHPFKDDKILTDWNGLIVSALARAGSIFKNKSYIKLAEESVKFIETKLVLDSQLMHRYHSGDAAIPALQSDYAFYINGLIELYSASYNPKYLTLALKWQKQLDEDFWDEIEGGYFISSTKHEQLILRRKEIYDGAYPSGNSIALINLIKLAKLSYNPELENKAEILLKAFSETMKQIPEAYVMSMVGLDLLVKGTREIVIVGSEGDGNENDFIKALRENFHPENIIIYMNENNRNELVKLIPNLIDYAMIENKTTAYLCQNYSCELPILDLKELIREIEK